MTSLFSPEPFVDLKDTYYRLSGFIYDICRHEGSVISELTEFFEDSSLPVFVFVLVHDVPPDYFLGSFCKSNTFVGVNLLTILLKCCPLSYDLVDAYISLEFEFEFKFGILLILDF